ncbi:hypothetical protein MJO28_012550 [Puccinia striiformis f. sp. tritici]|uniref:RING-type domain-containing protein n=2 Tax=Puccinia striiformis f. sp. tritici TaxID=168172 RepID=A0A0L0VQT3_9BASI|nr:hypothetical protein MJO28_012550 [Puccinia striiformis f. sp. tritici]KAI7945497.1 hypothetical protein MJO29_011885 [Puccinia striiformis f. sp. tritici]KNF01557.1 hypothetical protein, variant [Puccinia striiformis f. sp. tritici PST-78]
MSTDSSPVLVDRDASRFLTQCGYMYRDEHSISKTLLCSICSEPWVQPVVATGCGHMFCERCIHTWIRHIPSCPIDRSSLPSNQLIQPPRILSELVDELEVICSLGCGWTGRRDCWKNHLEIDCPEAQENEPIIPSALLIEKIDSPEPEDEEESFKERWKKLAREMHVLKREAKDYISTIERFKDKVSKLQLELRQANELIIVKPPSPSPVTSPIPLPVHQATCDFCRSHIQGTRYKCLKCPDLDSCSECFPEMSNLHPIHDFVPIESPSDINILPEWSIVHPDVRCNQCEQQVIGPRFKCVICRDYDLCHHCMALPRPVHPIGHPMTRFVNPQG